MSRSLQFSVLHGLRHASTYYTPAHSKAGQNVSARLDINAYLNMATSSGDDKSEAIRLVAWDKAADILALCLTPGKEFTAFVDLNVYEAPVYWNDQTINAPDGTPLKRKAYSFTVRRFDLGNDAFKHIMAEIQAGVRGQYWWVKGHQDALNFKAELDRRMALVGHFDPNVHKGRFGFAEIRQPKGEQIGAYVPGQPVGTSNPPFAAGAGMVGTAPTPETVKAAFAQPQPVQPNPAVAQPITSGQPTAASFVMPTGV